MSTQYKQYITEHTTAFGIVVLTYTHITHDGVNYTLDDLYITVNGIAKHVPPHWTTQTSATIIRKLASVCR